MTNRLSIIIPCFNEIETLFVLLNKIEKVQLLNFEKEIIIIDDFSIDGTREELKKNNLNDYVIIYNDKNYGKGFCIKEGIKKATGNYIIIQDADLEYDPNDYKKLLQHVNHYDVVYGSRLNTNKKSSIWFYLGGILVTKITNILYRTKLTDQPTCYKLFKSDLLKSIELIENRFGFCSEVTAKISKQNIQIKEIPINYYPRTKKEGKKINWKDGLRAIYALIKYY